MITYHRYALFAIPAFIISLLLLYPYRESLISWKPTKEPPPPENAHQPWVYKPKPEVSPPIKDNFPLAATGKLPLIPSFNSPPHPHVPEKTPLLIGFTRNWRVLQQAVVSYIAAGWPPSDIYVIENTGVMDSNINGKLSLQNPFYIDHKRLTETFGVNVIRTPTLLNFAQLQNFYLSTALEKSWSAYFWSHMDVVVLSDEEKPEFKTLYNRAVDAYREWTTGRKKWAALWFSYDRLTLVNTAAYNAVGGWDTFIGYYLTDCDMHERLYMAGYETPTPEAGRVWDVASTLEDLAVLFRGNATIGDESYFKLRDSIQQLQNAKLDSDKGRNTWQSRQQGGKGEPYYRDADGFQEAINKAMDQGKDMYAEKWGHRGCDLRGSGLKNEDAWKVEKDF
jgi:hypothetical protein